MGMTPLPEIAYDDFAKLDLRIGTIRSVEQVPDTEKLLACTIDFGELGTRTIVSGIAQWKKPEDLVGKQCIYIVNLAPRILRGVESQGMLLACSDEAGVALIHPERPIAPGTALH
jgi:methionyl-tRNA synthetase